MSSPRQNPISPDAASVIGRLVQLRKQRGITQQDIATAVGLTRSHLSALERGKFEPKLSTVVRYCRAVGYQLSATPTPGRVS